MQLRIASPEKEILETDFSAIHAAKRNATSAARNKTNTRSSSLAQG